MAKIPQSDQLRLRVFAGPNGSGKTTIIQSVKNAVVNGKKIDFGIYINADDIASTLLKDKFSFNPYKVKPSRKDIISFAESSGLLNKHFSKKNLAKRFTFETVFSHKSNLDIMQRAADAGYKVYLYFVSTESPEINKFRVKFRVTQSGHNVPEDKIESRYYSSLNLLYDAAEIAYQCFFFDNSIDEEPYVLINHFKKNDNKKAWDTRDPKHFSQWFMKYYWSKIK